MDERELHLMRSAPGTVDAGGSPLYMIINDLSPVHGTSCIEAECVCSTFSCSRNASFVVRLVFLDSSSHSIPMEARYCIVPRNCRQKEGVLAYVRFKPWASQH